MSVSDFDDEVPAAEEIQPQRRTRRTNAQILEDQKKERAQRAAARKPPVRKRRTRAEIEADEDAYQERVAREAAERAAARPLPKKERVSVTIHFKEDGKTFNEKVWYRGEELTIVEGTREWDLAHNRFGEFIFNESEDEQYEKYGKVLYGPGPWPGRPYDFRLQYDGALFDDKGNLISGELSEREIKTLQKINQQRGLA